MDPAGQPVPLCQRPPVATQRHASAPGDRTWRWGGARGAAQPAWQRLRRAGAGGGAVLVQRARRLLPPGAGAQAAPRCGRVCLVGDGQLRGRRQRQSHQTASLAWRPLCICCASDCPVPRRFIAGAGLRAAFASDMASLAGFGGLVMRLRGEGHGQLHVVGPTGGPASQSYCPPASTILPLPQVPRPGSQQGPSSISNQCLPAQPPTCLPALSPARRHPCRCVQPAPLHPLAPPGCSGRGDGTLGGAADGVPGKQVVQACSLAAGQASCCVVLCRCLLADLLAG